MRRIRDLAFRLRALFTRGRMRRDLDEELRFHLDMETEKLVRQGRTPEDAAREARRKFGSPGRQRDRARWAWGLSTLEDAGADLRFVGRQLRRDPGFALGAVLTLGLGIGANTAIFSVADHALLRRPPVEAPERLVAVYTTARRGFPKAASSYPDFVDYRDMSRTFAAMAAYSSVPLNVGEIDTPRLAVGILVTGNYFELLGVRPQLGRPLDPGDDRQGAAERVVVLSHAFWREAFGADPAIVGRTIRLNDSPFVVVGVGPPGFDGLDLSTAADVWIPMFAGPTLGPGAGAASDADVATNRGARWIGTLIGRLAPGASLAGARADMDAVSRRLAERYPDERAAVDGPRGITLDPIDGYLLPVGSEDVLRRFVFLLLAVVGITLLLGSANLANLLLARATARRGEIGVRMALGAGSGRVARQLLTESLVLALLGCGVALAVAWLMLGGLAAFELPGGVSIGDLGVGLDGGVLGFALGLSVLTALLFGLVPALQTSRLDVVRAVKGESARRAGAVPLRKLLVAVQVGLCLVLLAGSGLFIRTMRNSLAADLGFEPAGAVAARFNLSLLGYTEEGGQAFLDGLLAGVRGIPGVEAAGVGTLVPFQDGGFRGAFVEVDGYERRPDEEIRVDYVAVEPGYFEALGIPILEGRGITGGDASGQAPVAVITRFMAERYWEGRSAVGGRMSFFEIPVEVVGVVDTPVWQAVGEEATAFAFLSQRQLQSTSSFLTLVARTSGDEAALLPVIRDRFRELDRGLSLTYLSTMDDLVAEALMPQRMGMTLLTMFAALAIVLAAVGVYGVVSYTVRRRARDIGIRIAIGAPRARILGSVLWEMAVPVVAGLLVGGIAAAALARTVATFMYGVSPGDPWTFFVISALLLVVSFGAMLLPARAAARTDPVRVLRAE